MAMTAITTRSSMSVKLRTKNVAGLAGHMGTHSTGRRIGRNDFSMRRRHRASLQLDACGLWLKASPHMSIATKTGDDGTTGLLFNRRVPKNHPRVEAYGTCDELNVALGVARSTLNASSAPTEIALATQLFGIQKKLVDLMGELATLPEDRERYARAKHVFITEADVEGLTSLVHEIEKQKIHFEGWATPGNSASSAALDTARVTCRRAERRVFDLGPEVQAVNPHVLRYLNRLSDLLWLMARKTETPS